MSIFDKRMKIHSLSFAINSAFGIAFDSFTSLQQFVTNVSSDVLSSKDASDLIGDDWQTVWGPVVFSECSTCGTVVADNTMAAYYSKSQNLFVIAIAGTNKLSTFSWDHEDIDVTTMVDWSTFDSNGSGQISAATANGLKILLNMTDSNGVYLQQGLKSFFSQNSITNPEVAVTGHSLGGALAPALALYLLNNAANWDPNAKSDTDAAMLSAYPTAGPTIGDQDLATYYESFISTTPTIGKIDYESVINSLDVVPKAWEAGTLGDIPGVYSTNNQGGSCTNTIPYDDAVADLVIGFAIDGLKAGGTNNNGQPTGSNPYVRIGTDTSLPSVFSCDVDNDVINQFSFVNTTNLPSTLSTSFTSYTNVQRFLAQVFTQHMYAYYALLAIAPFMAIYEVIVQNDKPSSSSISNGLFTKTRIAVDQD